MKKTTFFIAVMMMSFSAMAQLKVAILETVDKGQNVSYGVKLLLRSSLTSAISNTPGYEGYDRVDMASIAGEQEFQRTGNVSDSQIKQLGVATGAAYVLVAEAALYDETSIIITAKILDVESFGIKSSAVLISGLSPQEMKQSCANLAAQLLGTAPADITPKQTAAPAKAAAPKVNQPVLPVASTPGQISPTPLATLANGNTVYVSVSDESERMTYEEAVAACSCKGTGWRLPTIEELKLLEKNKNNYDDIHTSYRYWAYESGFTVDMSNGYKKATKNSVKAKVRCVKESR